MQVQRVYLIAANVSVNDVSPTMNLMLQMAQGFRANGCVCEVVELAAKESREGVWPFRTMVEGGGAGLRYMASTLRGMVRFWRLLEREGVGSSAGQNNSLRPVVISVSIYPMWVLLLSIFCRARKICFVAYIFEEWFSLHFYDELPIVRKLAGAVRRVPATLLLYCVCSRVATGVAVIVEEMRDFLVRNYGVDANKVFCFPNVVNAKSAPLLDCRGGAPMPYVVFAGYLSFAKDAVSKELEALSLLKRRGVQIQLRLYGKVVERQKARLSKEIDSFGVRDQVRFMGYVERDVLDRDLSQAVAALVIKRNVPFNRYNFPTKMMDALRLNVPLVVSTNALFLKYFKDRQSACIVSPDSAEEMADAIQFLTENPQTAKWMAARARELLDDEFNAEAVCGRFLKKYA